jgi:hypothetical protein
VYRTRDIVKGLTTDAEKIAPPVIGESFATLAAAYTAVNSVKAQFEKVIAYTEADRTTENRIEYSEGETYEDGSAKTYAITKTVNTLHFVPNNARDIHLIEQGMRCKMGLASLADFQNETSEAASLDITEVADNDLLLNNLTDLISSSKPIGLDRFFKSKPTEEPTLYSSNNNLTDGRNVMYPGAPCAVAWGGSNLPVGDSGDKFVSGIGIPFVDGDNKPILSRADAFHGEGWCDLIPDDSSFFIGNSFETFMESPGLVSGSDLTNATPLHLKLKYANLTDTNAPEQFFEHVSSKDVLTSFIHIDSVLRLQPDGTLISSV